MVICMMSGCHSILFGFEFRHTRLLLVAAGMRLFMWVTLWTCCVVLPVNYSVRPQRKQQLPNHTHHS